ncbi:DUF3494 domain-containing protein [bacterium]|nr:MAG: DUF3494 domain-containing protein [bacterium]
MLKIIRSGGFGFKLFSVGILVAMHAVAGAQVVSLGSAAPFAVLAGSKVANAGLSGVTGDLGVNPGTAITGFSPGMVSGTIFSGGGVAAQAQSDLTTAYNGLASLAPDWDLTGQDLGGMTLTPGVYSFSSSAQLTGGLILDYQNDPSASFVFQIVSTLTTASDASVFTINGGTGDHVFWQVGSSATLGTGTDFRGNILALTSITLTTGADILSGRALARNGAITMDTNEIALPQAVPEPASMAALALGGLALLRRRKALSLA